MKYRARQRACRTTPSDDPSGNVAPKFPSAGYFTAEALSHVCPDNDIVALWDSSRELDPDWTGKSTRIAAGRSANSRGSPAKFISASENPCMVTLEIGTTARLRVRNHQLTWRKTKYVRKEPRLRARSRDGSDHRPGCAGS